MKKKYLINYLLLCFVGILIFSLTEYIQWYGDAYLYRFDFSTGESIDRFQEILPSQYAHYFMMNGRVWAHVLCQGFSSLWGQTSFAVCNALVYVVFVLLFVKTVDGSWHRLSILLSSILIILFFSDTSYIPNCQIGYIWTSTVTLAFIVLFFRMGDGERRSLWKIIILFVLSLFAGNGNEAISIGVGVSLIVQCIKGLRKLSLSQWVMISGFGVGGIILCLSPGSLSRLSGDSANFVYSLYRLLLHSRSLYLLIFTLGLLKLRQKIQISTFIKKNRFYFVSLVSLLVFNFIIGIGKSGRQLFGVELFSAILTIRAFYNRSFPKWMILFMSVAVSIIYALKFEYLHECNEDLRRLRNEMVRSTDGVIFIDFKKYNKLVKPTEVRDLQYANPERSFFVNSFQDNMNDRGVYYQSVKNGIDPPPYSVVYNIYPTVMKDVLKLKDRNFAVKCPDGTYLIVRDCNLPKNFILYRSLNFFGLKIPLKPYIVDFRESQIYKFDSLDILLETFDVPLVENGEIEILPDLNS